jgi:putative aldouronate transport system substrate-binding protein
MNTKLRPVGIRTGYLTRSTPRSVALLLVLALVLSACGGSAGPTGQGPATAGPATQQTTAATAAPAAQATTQSGETAGAAGGAADDVDFTPNAGGTEPGPLATSGDVQFHTSGLPIVDQPITLSMIGKKAGSLTPDFDKMELFKRLEPQTNVHVEWQNIADADYQERKNLILASGDLPDAFWNTGFTDQDIATYGGNGTLIPLEDLIDQYAPNLKKVFERRPEVKQAITAPDGHIYTLPFAVEFKDIGATPFFHVINTAWLDKLGLKMPTTLDELHDVLVAFKTKDPNGNGQADEIPFSFMFNWWCADIGDLFGAFGMPDNLDHRIVRDGKVIYTAAQPEYRDAIAYFHKWVQEGLIDPESFAQDDKAYLAKGKTQEQTLGSYIWWEIEEVVGPDRAQDYALVPPLTGPTGKQGVGHSNGSPYGRTGFAITNANKYPEITMRWVDLMYDPYMSAQVIWGPLGLVYERNEQGMLVNKELPEGVSMGEYRQTVAPEGVGVILAEDFDTVVDMEPRAKQRIQDLEQVYKPHMEDEWYPSVFFTAEELEQLSTLETDIKNHVNEQRARWLVDGGIEQEWDGYVEQLNAMGLEQLLKIYQDALDRYKNPAQAGGS